MTVPTKKTKRITVITAGTYGSVQGVLGLALGLREAGYLVRFCAGENLKRPIVEHGFECAILDDTVMHLAPANEFLEQTDGKPRLRETARYAAGILRNYGQAVSRMVCTAWDAVQGSDAIVYRPHATGGRMLAQKLDVPCFLVEPAPLVTPTREFHNFLMPNLNLGRWYNGLSYSMFNLVTSPMHRSIRKRVRRIPEPPCPKLAPRRSNGRFTVLNTFSPHVLPRPHDWPEWAELPGYFFLPMRQGWEPSRELVEFLGNGPPPVYLGFGSMARNSRRTTQLVLEAIRESGQRFVLATGWGGLDPTCVPDTTFVLDAVPHEWLFPRMSAVIHHGGAATVGAGLRAGRPTVGCPFFGDQCFWSDVVYKIGAGPRPIQQNELSAERLLEAIRIVTGDEAMRERARRIGEKMRDENGVARAVEIIRERLR